jgi:predicted small lipoprotein YifL
MKPALILILLALTGCGVDGPPTAPNGTSPSAKVSISGTAQVGVAGKL